MEFPTNFLASRNEIFFVCFIFDILFFHASYSFESFAWFYLQFVLFCDCSIWLSSHLLHTKGLVNLSLQCQIFGSCDI